MRSIAIYTLVGLITALGVFGAGYVAGWESMVGQYTELASSVKAKNKAAAERLAALTRQRDKKQAELDRLALEQEKSDEEAQSEIKRLVSELDSRPVRVRFVSEPGHRGSVARGEGAGNSEAGEGDEAQAYGVLPKENTRRLREALSEVETLSAAYKSCRASYVNQIRR